MGKKMTLHPDTLWVTDDGSFGGGKVITIELDALTDAQWEVIALLNDYERIEYALAIMEGKPLNEWEDRWN